MSTGMFVVVIGSMAVSYLLGTLTGYLYRWSSELLQINNQLIDMIDWEEWEETADGEEVLPGDEWKYN
jgi:hypothetical protein